MSFLGKIAATFGHQWDSKLHVCLQRWVCWTTKSEVVQQSVNKSTSLSFVNLVKPKVRAKLEHLLNKPASVFQWPRQRQQPLWKKIKSTYTLLIIVVLVRRSTQIFFWLFFKTIPVGPWQFLFLSSCKTCLFKQVTLQWICDFASIHQPQQVADFFFRVSV